MPTPRRSYQPGKDPSAGACSDRLICCGGWTGWRHLSAEGTLPIVQAFQAKLPPLSTGADGIVRVSGSRVSLETVVTAFDSGATAEEIVQQYPSLDLAVVYAVISYALDHRADVDAYVAQRRDQAHALQQRVETHLPPAGIRERLLARRRPAGNG